MEADAQGVAEPVRVNMSLQEQADYVLTLSDRNYLSDGERAGEWSPVLTKQDALILYAVGMRLARIAPHEQAVRALVLGEQA